MPPRYAYWTILIGDEPTAFRAGAMEDIMPTFNRLKEKQPTAVLKWFQNGKLWTSRIEAREAMAFRGDKGRRNDPRHQPGASGGGWRGKPAIADRGAKPEWKAKSDARPEWKPKSEGLSRGAKPEWKPPSTKPQAPRGERGARPEWKPKERTYSPSAKPGWKPKGAGSVSVAKPTWKPEGESFSRGPKPEWKPKSAARPEWNPRGDDVKPAWKPKSASASPSPKPTSFAPSRGTGASADRQAPSREHRSRPEWKPKNSARPADAPTGRPDPRDKKWRPGGDHKDPRQKYKDAKKAKWTRFKQAIRARSGHKKKREGE